MYIIKVLVFELKVEEYLVIILKYVISEYGLIELVLYGGMIDGDELLVISEAYIAILASKFVGVEYLVLSWKENSERGVDGDE